MSLTLVQALTLYNWFLSTMLLVILLMIARFYQLKSRKRTFYPAFMLPVLLSGAASIRTAYVDQTAPDGLASVLTFVAGTLLIGLCLHLGRLMLGGRI